MLNWENTPPEVNTMSALQFKTKLSNEISISPAAVEQLINITNSEDNVAGIRIFVSGGGCGGMTYGMTLTEQPSDFDTVLEHDGLNVYVDSIALSFLEGVEIDYQTQGVNQSFVFKNVFAATGGAGTCGACGSAGGGCG